MSIVVAALYQFTRFEEPEALKVALAQTACASGVRGTLLLAHEGINGTIAGSRDGVDAVLAHIQDLPGCAEIGWKESTAQSQPFRRMKVRVKSEIVTLGKAADPTTRVGTYINAEDWNDVADDPDIVLIDTRNRYEVGIGSFEGAIDPGTESFRDFPSWWSENARRFEGKRIAMFCTGGIRCEKASSYLLGQGVPEVLHLEGGILKYLEKVPEAESRWQGECFVFDDRVALTHGLGQGEHSACYACGRPVSAEGRTHPDYVEGVSCANCIEEYSTADRARFAERQRQLDLAHRRGIRRIREEGSG